MTTQTDPALDEALERISDLAARLWAVRSAHRPVVAGRLRRTVVCGCCRLPAPCPTLQAAGQSTRSASVPRPISTSGPIR